MLLIAHRQPLADGIFMIRQVYAEGVLAIA